MFVDHIRIFAKAGDGGNGVATFRRAKYEPKGGPDGGDGGRGGDVVLRPSPSVDNLTNLFYEPIVKAPNGKPGQHQQKTGRSGKAVVVSVPVGTLVYRLPPGATLSKKAPPPQPDFTTNVAIDLEALPEETSEPSHAEPLEAMELVADLVEPDTDFVLCEGGRGGAGNVHYKSSINRAPSRYGEGKPGEQGYFYLELRKIADVGLVGFPNAGKSTLLTRLSAATPKVAAYPFTTLTPHLGIVEKPDEYQRIVVADIPGLVDGAADNVGLGHDFLRHIVRCKVLCLVVDTSGMEGREPVADIEHLRKELKLYDPTLAERPWLIAANKMDLPESEPHLENLRRRFDRVPIFPISADQPSGLTPLIDELFAVTERMATPTEPSPVDHAEDATS